MGLLIYEPRGKAREYAPLALNLYRGCVHGCIYCYAPDATFTPREEFSSPAYVGPRESPKYFMKALYKEAEALEQAKNKREILLSFTSDPYQPMEQTLGWTRQALEVLAMHRLTATILTKGGAWGIIRDGDLLALNPGNAWSVTLTHDNPDASRIWEPGAALPEDRIESLKIAKEKGLKTWVSFEPVIDPYAVYRLLEVTARFVDFYKVGKLNAYVQAPDFVKQREREIDWPEFRQNIEARLKALGKPYYLKKDLLAAK